ncbi:cysteine--tRNA ligase [Candidatus Marinimicrobia bacterium PRS2]|nr:cysteine--tRNA ligase [Candidatus Marinimicrobia bacterium PRS2]
MKFYNTLHRKKEDFQPLEKGKVTLYTCGPTVYDYAHIGNFRAYIFEDLLRRYLEFSGYDVLQVMNITDIDDKTIRRSIEEKMSLENFTHKYTSSFFEDVETLQILPAHHYPRATEFIPHMIKTIQQLEDKGFTYTTEDGSVFFKISQFSDYGKLANLNPDQLKSGDRVEDDEYGKEEGRDFALWKGFKPQDGDVNWDSPWGRGRPGWHIECSVMSTHYLSNHFDIHCGGVDNIFPHHENEIAQSCAASGEVFVNYWLHNEHLLVDGQKMSKSMGNFYTLRDLLEKGCSPEALRYTLISTHYRSKLNFTFEKVKAAQKCINKLRELKRRLKKIDNDGESEVLNSESETMLSKFSAQLGDDLNISGALGELFIWVNYLFAKLDNAKLDFCSAKGALSVLRKIDSILGVIDCANLEVDDNIHELIREREKARSDKDWDKADKVRGQLDELGIILDDTPEGTVWKRK